MGTNAATHPAEESGKTAAAFGLAAAVTVLFNTILALVKDAYQPLDQLMAALTGNHWVTQGLADVILFFAVGWLFTSRGIPAGGLTNATVATVTAASLIAGGLLAGWFLIF